MYFASDNSGPVPQEVLDALAEANSGYAMGYGDDPLTAEVQTRIREIFEAPQAAVYLVATGTAANVLGLATVTQPWQTIFCTPVAHIHQDECNAPEFYTGGAKLTLVGDGDRMTPETLRAAIEAEGNRGVHGPQRGCVSLTSVTECGTVYGLDELHALAAVAKGYGLPVHQDGARFANALVALDCSPAEMTWKAGVDVLSFGGTKNGLMGAEAVVLFDPDRAQEFEYRRKRGGHLFSKHRYLSAQMAAYLTDDLWLRLARLANERAAQLAQGLRDCGVDFAFEPAANMVFAQLTRATHKRLQDAGAIYHLWEGTQEGNDPDEFLTGRLVCDWSLPEQDVTRFLTVLKG
ncbi:threonine aldolase family protein [Primorskyibacter flagellatus]|uniref:L-threonine aldolase n=1 Tax=Primorskyibacter flagellatus TaxID=1387277 RepID=A0A1W2AM30_9RHOB|nr:low specificity L-threonine aldolase [Primorskyibacter flagellatus]SMC61723.1 L-threonine aldolase [Primorskyibacter flagellatus]